MLVVLGKLIPSWKAVPSVSDQSPLGLPRTPAWRPPHTLQTPAERRNANCRFEQLQVRGIPVWTRVGISLANKLQMGLLPIQGTGSRTTASAWGTSARGCQAIERTRDARSCHQQR